MTTNATIDLVRDYWDARPCNIRHSDLPLGSREYFDAVESKKLRVEPHIMDFTDFAQWRGRRVLEIGCGIGTAAVNFARCGADYTGVELSERSLELARRRFDVYGLTGRFYLADAEYLTSTVPVEPYDLVYSWGVIHHSPRPQEIIRQARQYMSRTSQLRIMVYAHDSWKRAMIDAELDQPEAQAGCPIALTYRREDIPNLLGPDLEIVNIQQDHIFPYEIDAYRRGEYVRQPWFQHMPAEMFRALERNFGWHMMITARLREAA